MKKMLGGRNMKDQEDKSKLLRKINDLLSKLSKKQLARIYDLIKVIYLYD